MTNKFRECAEKWEGYNLTWRCNKECQITDEQFKKIFEEQKKEFNRKFEYFYDTFIRDNVNFGLFFRETEPIKEHIFAVSYGARDKSSRGVIKIFKQNICTHNKHKITKEFRGQVFNIILHECLHNIFGGDEKIVTLITHRIGKYEGKTYDESVSKMKND